MKTAIPIVAGGGLIETRRERIKIRAWVTLYAAIVSAIIVGESMGPGFEWLFLVPLVLAVASLGLFLWEKPVEAELPGKDSRDPSKLYAHSTP